MSNIIQPRAHTIIGGVSGQMQSPLAAHLIFNALADDPKLQAIVLVEDEAEGRQFGETAQAWSRAEKRRINRSQTSFVKDLRLIRSAPDLQDAIERQWQFGKLLIVRDVSRNHQVLAPTDRWFTWADEVAGVYNAAVLTVLSTGVHKIIGEKLASYPVDQVWECEAAGQTVTLKAIRPAAGRKIEFAAKHGTSLTTFTEKERVPA